MKKLNFLIFAALLLFSQMGMLDHAYSEHHSGEVCDYCISTPSLDNALTSSTHINFSLNASQQHVVLAQTIETSDSFRFYYCTRTPSFNLNLKSTKLNR